MRQTMLKLWNDDSGVLLAIEYVAAITLLLIGLLTGYVAIRQSASSELTEVANATASLNQSYSFSGSVLRGCDDLCSDCRCVDGVWSCPDKNCRLNGKPCGDVQPNRHALAMTAGSAAVDTCDVIRKGSVTPETACRVDQSLCD